MLPAKTGDQSQRRDGQPSWPRKPHSAVFTEPHGLQRAVGRVDSSASPRSFTVPLWIWAGWPLWSSAKSCSLAHVRQQSPNQRSPLPRERCNPSMEFTWRAAQKTRDLHPKPFQSHTLRCNILPTHSSQVPGCPFFRLRRRKIIWKNVFWNKIFFPPKNWFSDLIYF